MYYKGFDVSAKLDLFLEPSDWDSELQLAKSSNLVNEKLLKLKSEILIRYNEDYTRGQIINSIWLKRVISDVFDRPHDENSLICQDKYLYFTDFCKYWLKDKSAKWKVNSKEYIGKSLLAQYEKFVEVFCEFEKTLESKIVLKDMSVDDFYEFANYLESHGYNPKTIERQIGRMKFFCLRCDEESIKISPAFRQRIYIDKDDEFDGIYLTEDEVMKIYNKDFSFDEKLQIAKENLLIGVFTGLRKSDYLSNLDLSNIDENYITITTQKTKTKVVIPIHRVIKEIISSRFGQLPPKMNEYEFGKAIKTIGMLCEFDEVVFGKKWNPIKKRKEKGYFKRYELFTTHICRRSMASNLYGKIPDDAILSILGWSNSAMLQRYNQTTKKQHADKLMNYWQK
jgi:integrase